MEAYPTFSGRPRKGPHRPDDPLSNPVRGDMFIETRPTTLFIVFQRRGGGNVVGCEKVSLSGCSSRAALGSRAAEKQKVARWVRLAINISPLAGLWFPPRNCWVTDCLAFSPCQTLMSPGSAPTIFQYENYC